MKRHFLWWKWLCNTYISSCWTCIRPWNIYLVFVIKMYAVLMCVPVCHNQSQSKNWNFMQCLCVFGMRLSGMGQGSEGLANLTKTIHSMFPFRLQMQLVKGCGREPRRCYCGSGGRAFMPSGIFLFKTVKGISSILLQLLWQEFITEFW
jgi:hypothetical protein